MVHCIVARMGVYTELATRASTEAERGVPQKKWRVPSKGQSFYRTLAFLS